MTYLGSVLEVFLTGTTDGLDMGGEGKRECIYFYTENISYYLQQKYNP